MSPLAWLPLVGTEMTAEISFDLVMRDNMEFVEGTFRLSGSDWQVFIFKRCPVERPKINSVEWNSGVSGFFVRIPESQKLDKATVQQVLSVLECI
jgi:hypothetical protein